MGFTHKIIIQIDADVSEKSPSSQIDKGMGFRCDMIIITDACVTGMS